MAQQRRPYRPKIKGCWECAKRRIDCDKTFPACQKCTWKGIACSGNGRVRFVVKFESSTKRHKRSAEFKKPFDDDLLDTPLVSKQSSLEISTADHFIRTNTGFTNTVAEVASRRYSFYASPLGQRNLTTFPHFGIDSSIPLLISHFSEKTAPQLVLIDDQSNGWRRYVIPIAHSDELVMYALLSASAFGLKSQGKQARIFYHNAIHGLQNRQNVNGQSVYEKQRIVLSLLLLLAGVILNGSPDFRRILRLVEAFLKAVHHEGSLDDDDLGRFLLRQVQKYEDQALHPRTIKINVTRFRGYASPFMSREEGLAVLSQTTSTTPPTAKGWEEFVCYCELYPDLSQVMSTFYDLSRKACNVYLSRLRIGSEGPPLWSQVEDFQKTMQQFVDGSPTEHALVWSVFFVAWESSTFSQREFFTSFLLRQYKRNGCNNIIMALECLRMK